MDIGPDLTRISHHRAMKNDHWALVMVCACVLLFGCITSGVLFWRFKRRAVRPPLPLKLLRGPGETLRRRIVKYEETLLQHIGGAALLPFGGACLLLWLIVRIFPVAPATEVIGLTVATVGFVAGFVFALRWALRDVERYRDDRLGYVAGLEVAEQLLPLVGRGYRLFHDVPAEAELSDRNLDHVAVGPNGVALVESKTRRKGRARSGTKEHVVVYDGRQLIWPWGDEGREIEQAIAEADWLKKFILQRTGITTNVKPVLAIPGWWVEPTSRGTVVVTTSNTVAGAVEGRGPRVLTDEQIVQIARHLDERCRDVED